jgi:hypothetical protein
MLRDKLTSATSATRKGGPVRRTGPRPRFSPKAKPYAGQPYYVRSFAKAEPVLYG